MATEGIQIQSGFVLQQYAPLDGRTAATSRAVRNAIEQKFDRMVVVLNGVVDRGTICTLKNVGVGFTITTWGTLNDHWDEEAPGEELPPVDPGAGPFLEIPWVDACDAVQELNQQPPLPEGQWIKVIERPSLQEGTYGNKVNDGVFGGDLYLFVLNPKALDFVGRRVRQSTVTGALEPELIHYRLLSDELLRVVDSRGNDVSGGLGISLFPFQVDHVYGNVVEEGASLAFLSLGNSGASLPSLLDLLEFEGTIANNHLAPEAQVWLGDVNSAGGFVVDVSGNVFATGAVTQGILCNRGKDFILRSCYFSALNRWSEVGVGVEVTNCRFEAVFYLPPDFVLGRVGEQFTYSGCELRPDSSTFSLLYGRDNSSPLILDTDLNWAGELILVAPNDSELTISSVIGLFPGRPLKISTLPVSEQGFARIILQHNPLLLGFNGADTEVQGNYAESVTIERVMPDSGGEQRARVVDYERHRPYEDEPTENGGHIIVYEGAPLPQQPNLVLQGDVTVTNDPVTNSTVINFNGQGEQGISGKGYQTTSSSANVLAAGLRTFVCDTPADLLAYTPGCRVRASSVAAPATVFVEGVVTEATPVGNVLTVKVAVDFVSGISAVPIAAWNLNVAGEPPLYRPGQVDYVAGKATLRLETGSAFLVDLTNGALGAATTITLDYTAPRVGLSVRIRVKQRATAPFRQLAYTTGKFATAFGAVNGAVPLQQTANAVDKLTGAFDDDGAAGAPGPMALVFVPAVSLIA